MKKITLSNSKLNKQNITNFTFQIFKRNMYLNIVYFINLLILGIMVSLSPLILKYFLDYSLGDVSIPMDKQILFILFTVFLVSQIILDASKRKIATSLTNSSNNYYRDEIYQKFLKGELTSIKKNHAKIISVVTNDIQNCQAFLNSIVFELLIQLITFIIIIFVLLNINPLLTSLLILSIPFYIVIFVVFNKKKQKYIKKYISNRDELLYSTNQIITNNQGIKNYENNKYGFLNVYIKSQYNITESFRNTAFIEIINSLLFSILQYSLLGLIMFIGFNQLENNQITLGTFTAFVLYVFNFFSPVKVIITLLYSINTTLLSISRVKEVLDIDEEDKKISSIYHDSTQTITAGKIFVKSVRIVNTIVNEICLERGAINYIQGKNGVGKSTFVNLIMKFNNLPRNSIFIDSVDINDISTFEVRKTIKVLYQNPQPTEEDIKEIKNDIKERLEVTNDILLRDFIEKNMLKYEDKNKFSTLSGGEKQLLLFLKAISFRPKILIVDEGFSNLDFNIKNDIINFLSVLKNTCNIIIITHETINDKSNIIRM